MTEEMQIEVPVFEVREVDLEYEFDVAQFFDFTREESPSEARDAERWFESAPSYPPSPFVTRLSLGGGNLLENVTTPPKCKEAENVMALDFSSMNTTTKGSTGGIFNNIQKVLHKVLNQPFQLTTGLTTTNHIPSDKPKAKTNEMKLFMPRNSTLMKPTASQLAKQNRPPQVASSRFKKLLLPNSDRSLGNSSVVESQAAKRQKLDGDLTRKVDEVKQQTTLVHKVPKRSVTEHKNTINIRPKLTIPREPELRTAHRAQRILPKNSTEQEHVTSVMHKFKARPLNRNILKAPSLPLPKKSIPKLPEFQEFHLKTSERAVQLSTAVSSSSFQTNHSDKESVNPCTNSANCNGTREARRPSAMDATRLETCVTNYDFKDYPLNKKIHTGKKDNGVFQNIKRATTVPMEFHIHRERRAPQNPPIELFSKLSLVSELQRSNGSRMKLPCPTFISTKGFKENRLISLQSEYQVTTQVSHDSGTKFGTKSISFQVRHLAKEKQLVFG